MALYPKQTVFAEESRDIVWPLAIEHAQHLTRQQKKPIYDDHPTEIPEPTPPKAPTPAPEQPATAASPTPTDILTAQVRQARLFLYSQSLAAETGFNAFLSRALNVENAFTNTVASLAPSADSGERLLPGGVYVVVSAMAGSIVSRNRGIFLRAASPLAFGTVAAWSLVPVTMRNVSDLVWEYEKQVPALAEQHLFVREKGEHIWHTGVAHSAMTRQMMEDKIGDARRKLEELVSRGH